MTPGEMLKEEFLTEYRLSQNQLAKALGISPNRIAEIVNNRRRITADTALELKIIAGDRVFEVRTHSWARPDVLRDQCPRLDYRGKV